ncbi:MAG: DMT family transporter [Paracoccaceae bacterium]|nr:MAG: DMT family transporter [Alphaproteobacteria bacterium]
MLKLKRSYLGVLVALITVSIWAVFIVATRFSVSTKFTVEEVLILRLVPSTLIMAPFMIKYDLIPRGLSWLKAGMLMIGASAIFPYIVSSGLSFAPASDGGVLAPGMLPFWTALAAFFILGEKLDQVRRTGLLIILIGALMVGLWQIIFNSDEGVWRGHILFLIGSGLFAIYSVIFRQSGLTPLHGLLIGLFWGTLFITPILLLTGKVTFHDVSAFDIGITIFIQSLVIGILATILFNYGVRLIGASEMGAFGALTPILAMMGGILFLNESVPAIKMAGIFLVAIGVFLASGILEQKNSHNKKS